MSGDYMADVCRERVRRNGYNPRALQIVSPTTRRLAVLAAATTPIFALSAQSAFAGVAFPDGGVSPSVDTTIKVMTGFAILATVVVIGVVIALLGAIRNGEGDSDTPEHAPMALKVSASATFVVLLLVGLFVYNEATTVESSTVKFSPVNYKPLSASDPLSPVAGIRNPNDLANPEGKNNDYLQVYANGQQYLWRYTYPFGNGVTDYHTLVVPVGVTVVMDLTSSDVTHSWWVPQIGGSTDAVPGYVNRMWFRLDKPGTYRGSSTVLSGPNYPSMSTVVKAVSPEEFRLHVAKLAADQAAAFKLLVLSRKAGKTAPAGDQAPPQGK